MFYIIKDLECLHEKYILTNFEPARLVSFSVLCSFYSFSPLEINYCKWAKVLNWLPLTQIVFLFFNILFSLHGTLLYCYISLNFLYYIFCFQYINSLNILAKVDIVILLYQGQIWRGNCLIILRTAHQKTLGYLPGQIW